MDLARFERPRRTAGRSLTTSRDKTPEASDGRPASSRRRQLQESATNRLAITPMMRFGELRHGAGEPDFQ